MGVLNVINECAITKLKVMDDGTFLVKTDPSGRSYSMTSAHLKKHFAALEEDWFSRVLKKQIPQSELDKDGFATVPIGGKSPLCVLDSLHKAFVHIGDEHAAQVAAAHFDASLLQKNRMGYAATLGFAMGRDPRKVTANALEYVAEHPTLLQVSRTHAVTLLGALIFDCNETKPLPLTAANFKRCIGEEYRGDVVRGYTFVPQLRKEKRARVEGGIDSLKRARE